MKFSFDGSRKVTIKVGGKVYRVPLRAVSAFIGE